MITLRRLIALMAIASIVVIGGGCSVVHSHIQCMETETGIKTQPIRLACGALSPEDKPAEDTTLTANNRDSSILSVNDTTFILKKDGPAPVQSPVQWEFDQRGAGVLDYASEIQVERWVNSKPIKLMDLKGKIIILDFWSVDNPSSVNALRLMQKLQEHFGERGVVFIGIHHYTDDISSVKRVIEEKKITYPVAIDCKSSYTNSGGITMDSYGGRGFSYIINRDGSVSPVISKAEMEADLVESLAMDMKK